MQSTFLSKSPTLSKHSGSKTSAETMFSIIIPSWNNLIYLKTCINSLKNNSRYLHQIIVHLNEGSDGSLSWVKEQGLDFTQSAENIGICYAMNLARTLATNEFLVYFNDDMYACPDWDFWLHEEIKKQTTPYFFISSTMIEPRESGNTCAIAPFDYGNSPENFNEAALLKCFTMPTKADWNGATWPPSVIPTILWDIVGGYSTDFSPGMYSDPDFSMKLWEFGVRDFKGVGKSRVYHFMSKSTGKLTFKKNGSHLFLHKWGMSSNVFTKYFLLRGQDWNGSLELPRITFNLKIKIWLNKMKRKLI